MMEYIFFNTELAERFAEFARLTGAGCEERGDKMGLIVAVPEDLDEELNNRLDTYYAHLLDEQAEMVEESEPNLKHTTAINITLNDGRPCAIRIEPAIMNKLMDCLSIAEIHELATTIARSVENPDNRPLCQT
jgi:hypothetical protein